MRLAHHLGSHFYENDRLEETLDGNEGGSRRQGNVGEGLAQAAITCVPSKKPVTDGALHFQRMRKEKQELGAVLDEELEPSRERM